MAIFSFLAKLGLDTTDFQAGVKRAQSSAAGLGKGLNSHLGASFKSLGANMAAAFSVAAVTGFASKVAETAGEIKDMSELLGVSTDEVQRLQIASEEAGISFAKIVGAFQKIEQKKAEALTGDEKSAGLFGLLGIDPNGNSIDILKAAVDASEKGAKENAAAFELLGGKVVHLKRVVQELNSLPKVDLISEQAINKIDEAEKTASRMWRRAWMATVGATGNAMANIEAMKVAYDAHSYASIAAENAGMTGEEAKRFRMERMGQALEGLQASQLGISVDQLRARNSPTQQAAQSQDQNALLLEAARANIKTFEILSQNVRQ